MRTFGVLLLFCGFFHGSGRASEVFHLANGFQLQALSHTQNDTHLILQTTTGSLELPLSDVASIETVPDRNSTGDTPPATTPDARSVERALQRAAVAEGLPAAFVRSVARAESGYNPNAVSPKGAVGLMQLMPGTAAVLGVRPTLVEQNAEGGAKYLRDLLVRYKGNAVLALAAYNAGPGAVSKYGGLPPYQETRKYVERVLREYARQQKLNTAAHPSVAATRLSTPSATN